MKVVLTVQDIRTLKQKVDKNQPESDRYYIAKLTEMLELMFLKNEDQQKEIDGLRKELKKVERKLTIELNRVSSRK